MKLKGLCLTGAFFAVAAFGEDMPFYAPGAAPVLPTPVGRVVSISACPVDSRLPNGPLLSTRFVGTFRTNKSVAMHIFIR